MRDAFSAVRQGFGQLHGVIHSAGVAGGGIIELKTREMAERVFAPKVEGTRVLYALLHGQKLDFFAICSSMSSIIGGAGQADYCAANNFLDAFGTRYGAEFPVVSINWDQWSEVGMAVNTQVPEDLRALRAAMLATAITPAEGAEAFSRVLSTRLRQVAVCTTGVEAALNPEPVDTREHEAVPNEVPADAHPRPELAVPFAAPRDDREKMLASIWGSLLGIERVGRDDSFFELGGHSLLAVQCLSRIREVTGVKLAVADLFELKTVAAVAARIDQVGKEAPGEDWRRLLDEVESLTDAEVSERSANRLRAGAN